MLESTTRTLLAATQKTRERSRDLIAATQVKTRQSEEIIARSKELLTHSKSLACSRSSLDFLSRRPLGPSLIIPNHLSLRPSVTERATKLFFVTAAFLGRLRN
jgi:hypothetical protein